MKFVFSPVFRVSAGLALFALGCFAPATLAQVSFPAPSTKVDAATTAQPTVVAARSQIGVTTSYDPAYRSLAYPNGDVPADRGVCTDVIIRALRAGTALDLQQLVHEDMKANFAVYPKQWGLKKPDKNIDHRRVPNLQTYFTRRGWSLPVTDQANDYQAGDLVTCMVGGKLPHIMIVSSTKTKDGRPLIIHNIGSGTQEEDRLFEFKLTGHYRLSTAKAAPR